MDDVGRALRQGRSRKPTMIDIPKTILVAIVVLGAHTAVLGQAGPPPPPPQPIGAPGGTPGRTTVAILPPIRTSGTADRDFALQQQTAAALARQLASIDGFSVIPEASVREAATKLNIPATPSAGQMRALGAALMADYVVPTELTVRNEQRALGLPGLGAARNGQSTVDISIRFIDVSSGLLAAAAAGETTSTASTGRGDERAADEAVRSALASMDAATLQRLRRDR